MGAKLWLAAAAASLSAVAPGPIPPAALRPFLAAQTLVRTWTITYVAHDGRRRHAYVVLPRRAGPAHPVRLPLIISPHGRGVPARTNARLWGDLPAIGRFAVVNPEGQGRKLTLYSWGDPGEIADLARMPAIVHRALPWLTIEPHRVFAFGSSMGGQETLLLLARYPQILAGAAAFDSATNLAARYQAFRFLPFGIDLQRLARIEVGGAPWNDPHAWALRSPIDWARQIARSHVPLQLWWSWRDQIVVDQNRESGQLYRDIKRIDPHAPVLQVVGYWRHSAEFKASRRLPLALALFGLLPPYRTRAVSSPGA
jgi:pimeloyl-ACP methyl ester carboxylesterase